MRVLPLACTAHTTTHVYLLVYPAVLLLVEREFPTTSNQQLGWIYVVGFFFGLTALPTGWLVARFGAPRVLAAGFLVACAASAAVGLVSSLGQLALCLLLLNLGLGVYHPAANTLISHHAPRRGRALGIHGTFGSVGEALGPVVAVVLAVLLASWRGAFVAMALPGLLLAAGFLWLGRTLPAEPEEHQEDRHAGPFFNGPLLLVFLVLLLNGFTYRAVLLFLPKFMEAAGPAYGWLSAGKELGLRGGLFAGLILGLGGVGQWVSGHLSDRHDRALLLVGFYLVSALALFGMSLASGPALLAISLCFGFVYFMVQPVTNALVAQLSTARLRGWAFGLAFFAQFGPGAFAQPLGGFVADRQGLHAVYAWCAAWAVLVAAVAGVLAAVLRRRASTGRGA